VPDGHIPLFSQTYQGYALLRSILTSGNDADIVKALNYGRRIRFYPLSAGASAAQTTYLDAAGVLFDATIPYDVRFFESLARTVESQPWLERDKAMIDPLRTLGIEKGRVFAPDVRTSQIMKEAAQEAHQWLSPVRVRWPERIGAGCREEPNRRSDRRRQCASPAHFLFGADSDIRPPRCCLTSAMSAPHDPNGRASVCTLRACCFLRFTCSNRSPRGTACRQACPRPRCIAAEL
jgi:hypothetical protein